MRSTFPSPAPVPARPTAGGPPPRRLVLRGAGAGGAALVLALVDGCRLRLGTGAPESLPSPPAAEEARDQLARRAVLIASTADVVADGGSMDAAGPAQGLASAARTQLQALGGVWEPWASESPAADPDRPTTSPAATASPGATVHDLVTALTEGATQASTVARESSEATAARLYASLGVAWLLGTAALDAQAAEISGRSPSSLTDPLPDGVLEAYDSVTRSRRWRRGQRATSAPGPSPMPSTPPASSPPRWRWAGRTGACPPTRPPRGPTTGPHRM